MPRPPRLRATPRPGCSPPTTSAPTALDTRAISADGGRQCARREIGASDEVQEGTEAARRRRPNEVQARHRRAEPGCELRISVERFDLVHQVAREELVLGDVD